jgi:hypothetical protein
MTEVVLSRSSVHVPGRVHDILLVTLVALRPLVWSGEAAAWDNLAWLLLVIGALGWLVVDAWRGRVPAWRFGVGGMLVALLLAVLLPAALRSPYPSTGMGLWGMAVVHLGFAAYLMQVVPGRERLAFGALVGGLAVECLIALGQWAWVLPGMQHALAGGDPAIAALETANGDLANRVAYGGLFGTFTLANSLAAFLLLAAVPVVGGLGHAHGRGRVFVGALAALVAIVAIGTSSKGAYLALAAAGGMVWLLHRHDRWRWMPLCLGVLAMAVIATMPAVRGLGEASAAVRLGYWQGAAALIAERPFTGHGVNAFAAHSGRTMPSDAEPTRHVHNDVLEASVDGGLLAGVLVLAWLLWSARRREERFETLPTISRHQLWHSVWPLLLIVPVFCALGMLASNVTWWPLGGQEATWWIWPVVLGGVLVGVTVISVDLPLPSICAWRVALAAFALHCLIDFDLQSPGLWGTCCVVAVLAGGRAWAIGSCAISRSVVTLLVALLALATAFGIQRTVPRALWAATMPSSDTPVSQAAAWIAEAHRSALVWPIDHDLLMASVRRHPPGAARLDWSSDLARRCPWSAQAQELSAVDLSLAGRWEEAILVMRDAVAANPAYLPRRQRLIDLLRRTGTALPSRADALHKEIELEERLIADLTPVVHFRNRPLPTASALPVQPTPQQDRR